MINSFGIKIVAGRFILILMINASGVCPFVWASDVFPGGQVRSRSDPLEAAVDVPFAFAAFASPSEIDGDITDPCWSGASWRGLDPTFAACFDRSALHVAISRSSRSPAGRTLGLNDRRDGPVELGETIILRIAPSDHQEMFIDLLLAPDGTVADRQMTWTPDGVGRFYQGRDLKGLRIASQISCGVWTAEVSIPWDALWSRAPGRDEGAILRLQVVARDACAAHWQSWPAAIGDLDSPPSSFGLLLLGGVMPPWRALYGELIAGSTGRFLALALARGEEAVSAGELIVEGGFVGRARLQLQQRYGHFLVPVEISQSGCKDGYGLFSARVVIDGRSWALGGWHLRDPVIGGLGSVLVPGVGGELSSEMRSIAGFSLAATAVPAGRKAIDLRIGALASGSGPWRLDVSAGGMALATLDIPCLPAVAAIPLAGLNVGRQMLAVSMRGRVDVSILSARLPLEIIP